MSNIIVSIIIVTKEITKYLKPCLDSVKGQIYPGEVEVLVIDNSLNREYAEGIRKGYPQVKLFSPERGLSYCAALNLGINNSRGDFILCLNDDTELAQNFLAETIKGFSKGPRVGMVSGKILRRDKKTLDSAGLFLSIFYTACERGYGSKDLGQLEKEGDVFGVGGAVAFYRKEMLEEIKSGPDYFDPDFGFFYEDLDVSWRARNSGWKGYYIPKAVAYHVRGATARGNAGINRPFARRYLSDDLHLDLMKNRYLCVIKNESGLNFLGHIPFMAAYDVLALGYCLFFKPRLIGLFFKNLKYLKSGLNRRWKKKSVFNLTNYYKGCIFCLLCKRHI